MIRENHGEISKKKILYNALGFNLVWWGCVFGVRWELPWLGPALLALYLVVHLRFFSLGRKEAIFLLVAGLIGTLVDSLKATSGFISYEGGYGVGWITPLWITAMWVGFAALLNHSLAWLKGRLILAAVLGMVFGPPAYLTGSKFGVLTFGVEQGFAIIILAIVWGLAVPMLVFMAEKMVKERIYV